MSKTYRGSCLCGGVAYEYAGEFGLFSLCYCAQCRKAQGSAFVAVLPVNTTDFKLIRGENLLKAYSASPGKERVFCGTCGSPLFSRLQSKPELLRLRVGTLDTPIGRKPESHQFVASKADWYDILDHVPQYAERPPH
jgi:hypothetical protein